jgi:hypothetical protein
MNKIVDFAPYLKEATEEGFSTKIGGTIYEVTTHFDPDGKQSVLEQFKELLLKNDLAPHI